VIHPASADIGHSLRPAAGFPSITMSESHIIGFHTCSSGQHFGVCRQCGHGHGWILKVEHRAHVPHLYRCSVCQAIRETDEQSLTFGPRSLQEEFPRECVYTCSRDCENIARQRLESGLWATPRLRGAFAGTDHDIAVPRHGYPAQPTQRDLIRSLIQCAHSNPATPMTDHQIMIQMISSTNGAVARAREAFFAIDPSTPMPDSVVNEIRAAYLSGISQASSFLVRGDGAVSPQQMERACALAGTHFGFESSSH